MTRNLCFAAVLAVATGLSIQAPASETDSTVPQDRETCINLRLVDQTLVLDDQNIVYEMRGGALYRNTLAAQCGGLFNQGNFYFQLTNPYRVCKGDAFTVFHTLTSCKLGYFEPISKAEFTRLKHEFTAAREAGKSKSTD
jgi:hypothetical protein